MVSTTVGNIVGIIFTGVVTFLIAGYVYLAYGPQIKDAIDKIMSGKLQGSLANDPILGSGSQPKVLLSSNPGYVYDLSDEAKYEPWALQL